jgi:hypothetical protein
MMKATCSAGGSFMRIIAARALPEIAVQLLTRQLQHFAQEFPASEGGGGQALDDKCAARDR